MGNYCEIVVKCQLDPGWSDWLEGLRITYNHQGGTLISGQLRDQTAFYGLLAKVRDMCPSLLSVKYVADDSLQAHGDSDHPS